MTLQTRCTRTTALGLTAIASLAFALYPMSGLAFCITTANRPFLEVTNQASVPVWVESSQNALWLADVDDLSNLDVHRRYVEAAINIINTSSHGGPRLFFAGYTGLNVPWSFNDFPGDGIVIGAFGTCADQNTAQTGLPDTQANFATTVGNPTNTRAFTRVARGSDFACNGPDDHPPLQNYAWWVDPRNDNGGVGNIHDFIGVLVHELLHSLRLNHTDGNESCVNGTPPEAYSAMWPSRKDWRRRLRRDDVEGLRFLYGEPEREILQMRSLSSTPAPNSWAAALEVDDSLRTNTPLSASDGARANVNKVLVGFTNTQDEVRFFTGVADTWGAETATGGTQLLVDGDPVVTFDKVEVALGHTGITQAERRIVAWNSNASGGCCAGEQTSTTTGQETRIWWRTFANGAWQAPQSAGPTRFKNFAVSYDSDRDMFVLAYLDAFPDNNLVGDQRVFVRTINAVSGGGGCTQAFTTVDPALEVGGVACDDGPPVGATRCVVTLSTTTTDGPALRFLQGNIVDLDPGPGVTMCFSRDGQDDPNVVPLTIPVDDSFTNQRIFWPGYLDGAFHGGTLEGTFVGAYQRQITTGTVPAARLYTMGRFAVGGGLNGVIANEKTVETNGWPLAVSSQTTTFGVRFRAWLAL